MISKLTPVCMKQDSLFANMAYHDWQAALRPKVDGSWNLHKLLSPDLDFFIMLSSATGIMGNKSQANYAVGNTFQDGLAKYRVSKGLRASSVDLGAVLDIGFVAENKDYARHTTAALRSLQESEIHMILEHLIETQIKISAQDEPPYCQLVAGLNTEAMYYEQGLETPSYFRFPLFTHLRKSYTHSKAGYNKSSGVQVGSALQAAKSQEEAVTIVCEGITTKLSTLLAVPNDNIDSSRSPSSNGVDSLIATEFRTWLARELKSELPLLEITGNASLSALASKIVSVSKLFHPAVSRTSNGTDLP